MNSKDIKKITKIKEDRITELTKTKNDLEKGLVGIETDNILNNFPSDEVYKSLKKDLTRRYHQTLSEIEEIKNTLRQIGDDIKWLDSIDTFGKQIQEKRDIPDPMKKELLKSILENIKVEYDHIVKVHRLTINFKIPVLIGDEGSSLTTRIEVKPPKCGRKTLVKPKDQIDPVRDYSTVTESNPRGSIDRPTLGYSIRLSVELLSSNLWISSYTPYQQLLFDYITKFHDEEGLNFKEISDKLNQDNYLTPRGKIFKENHVWSIYVKKNKSISRFGREFEPQITDIKVDVLDYVPVP